MATVEDDQLFFADSEPAGIAVREPAPPAKPWKLAIVDDDEGVHAVTRLVLSNFKYRNRPIQLFHAYSAVQGRELLRAEPDIAAMLLDVVMETDQAGLDLVKYIRSELGNQMIRIILRTGQPGQAPEIRVIAEYDINDYKEKGDLSAQKLVTSVTVALRGHDDLLKLQAQALAAGGRSGDADPAATAH